MSDHQMDSGPTKIDVSRSPRNRYKNIFLADHVRVGIINWGNVVMQYVSYAVYGLLAVLCYQMCYDLHYHHIEILDVFRLVRKTLQQLDLVDLQLVATALAMSVVVWIWQRYRSRSVFLVDFACFQPSPEWQITHQDFVRLMELTGTFKPESVNFMRRIIETSGTGQATHLPPSITKPLRDPTAQSDCSVEAAREEAKTVLFGSMSQLLEQTKINPKDVDFLVINCSLFSPTPSLCSMVAAEFKMNPQLKTYNLSGMGCSAGVIAIDLAKELLQANPDSTAIVLSTENLTQNMYQGNERAFLLQNTLFRVGGAAILLSNRWQDGFRAKYRLLHTVRVQHSGDESLNCVYETEDSEGKRGIRLSKDIVNVAGKALESNLTLLGPLVLPLPEQAKVLTNIVIRKFQRFARQVCEARKWRDIASKLSVKIPVYIPDFKKGIDHFCIHAGGRAVIDGIEKNLQLTPEHTEASRKTLYNFGNTSSSSIWYELDYIEKHQDLRRGHRVLQVAFGSGFKCNSAVWLRVR